MPRYTFECQKCDKEYEIGMTLSEHDKISRKKKWVKCPHCKGMLRQILSAVRFRIN